MQTARHFVRVFVELTAGVQDRHYHFERAAMLFRVHIYRDTAAIILHRDAVVFVDGYLDMIAETRERFVD